MDSARRIEERIRDYFLMGVPYVWALDSETQRAFRAAPEALREVTDGVLRTENPVLEVPLSEIFR
jgi:hypothetical protein